MDLQQHSCYVTELYSEVMHFLLMSTGGHGGRIGLMLFDVLKPVRSLTAALSQGVELVITD